MRQVSCLSLNIKYKAKPNHLVIILPVTLLWNVRINIRKKLTLIALFSMTTFIMITSVIRIVFANSSASFLDQSWFYSWSAIEMAVGTSILHITPIDKPNSIMFERLTIHSGYSCLSCLFPCLVYLPHQLAAQNRISERTEQ